MEAVDGVILFRPVEAVIRTGGSERERHELRQRFQIIDEVRDCRQLKPWLDTMDSDPAGGSERPPVGRTQRGADRKAG